jgi:predicted DNA-binding protein (MmcQ/YjbR family)
MAPLDTYNFTHSMLRKARKINVAYFAKRVSRGAPYNVTNVRKLMDLPDLIDYCLQLPHCEESTPFGTHTLMYKVGGKVFAITGVDAFPTFANLKCDPKRSLVLREQYHGITAAYHMNKKHWNSVMLNGRVPTELIRELVDHSYDLVHRSLSKAQRETVKAR